MPIEAQLLSRNEEPLICRKVVRSGVVVASLHPIIGPVYWDYVDNSDCNAPDTYQFTNNERDAMIFGLSIIVDALFYHFNGVLLAAAMTMQRGPYIEEKNFITKLIRLKYDGS